jgi:hypothetical protein
MVDHHFLEIQKLNVAFIENKKEFLEKSNEENSR